MIDKKNILGVGITDATKEEVLEYIVKNIENFKKRLFIVTPNPEFLILASKDSRFKKILNRADLASADGIGLMIAGKLLGKPLKERLTGVELLEMLCRAVAEKPITVGFLGGRDRVAEKTAECLRLRYPNLKISFVGEEWPINGMDGRRLNVEGRNLKIEDRKSINPQSSTVKIPSSTFYHLPSRDIDILFVAFGAPKQEFWIYENLDKIPVKVAIGVGGAFDYISGRIPRAPGFIRQVGFEWLYRLIRQSWRLKRQLALLEFVVLILKEKFNL